MKRGFSIFALTTLFVCLLAFESCYAQGSGKEDTGAIAQGGAAAAPPPTQTYAAPPPTQGSPAGVWVQIPGESVGGTWVPPHLAWSPTPEEPRPMQYRYAVPAYAVVPAPNFGSVFLDIVFLRPLGIAGLVVGTAAAVVATPFALPSGSEDVVGRTLIGGPCDFTFRRPLGVW